MVLGVVYLVMVGITRGEVVYHSPVKNVIHVYSTDGHASLTEVDFLGQSGYPVSIPKDLSVQAFAVALQRRQYLERAHTMPQQSKEIQMWDLWISDVGATGISFARSRIDATDTIIVHAAPEKLDVEVRTTDGSLIAKGESLSRTADIPMARLRRQGNKITRETLQKWWNDAQHQEWRWSLEFYNHR